MPHTPSPILPFLLFLLLLLPPILAQCPDVLTLTDKVINGNPSLPSYHIALASPPNPAIRRCTASRISTNWALTAAHCNVNTSWTVSIAGQTIFSGAPARVTQVYTHPQYQQPTDRRFDIALVKLSGAGGGGGEVVKLNDHPAIPLSEAFVRVAGYGAIDTSTNPTFGNLTHVDIPVVAFGECRTLYSDTANLGILDGEKQLCAGYLQGGCDACSGDSGGPVVQFDQQGDPVQVALVSASRGCALPGFPGIGVRVDAFLPWIRQVGAEFETGRGMQVLKAAGGRLVTKDPPSGGGDSGADGNGADGNGAAAPQPPKPEPSASSSPVVVATSKPTKPKQPVDNRLPSPSPSTIPVKPPKSGAKPDTKPDKQKDRGVDTPLGPRPPPAKPTPNSEGETLGGIEPEEEDDDTGASAEPEGETGALAGDVAVGAEISGSTPAGAIAGGVVGGLVLVALVIAGFVFLGKNGSQNAQTDSDDTAEVGTDAAQDVEAAQGVVES